MRQRKWGLLALLTITACLTACSGEKDGKADTAASAKYQFSAPDKGVICQGANDSAWIGSADETHTSATRNEKSADLEAYREFMKNTYTTGLNSTLLADLTGDGRDDLIVVSSLVLDENGNPLNESSEKAKELRKRDKEYGKMNWQTIRNTVTEYPQASPYPNIGYTGFHTSIVIRVYTRDEESGSITCLYEDDAAYPHAGHNWLYLYEEDGRDYLLKYSPSMWQGMGGYDYKIFSLLESGQEQVLRAEEEVYGTVDVEDDDKRKLWDKMGLFIRQVDQYRSKSIPLVEIGSDYFDAEYDSMQEREYNYVVQCDELGTAE